MPLFRCQKKAPIGAQSPDRHFQFPNSAKRLARDRFEFCRDQFLMCNETDTFGYTRGHSGTSHPYRAATSYLSSKIGRMQYQVQPRPCSYSAWASSSLGYFFALCSSSFPFEFQVSGTPARRAILLTITWRPWRPFTYTALRQRSPVQC